LWDEIEIAYRWWTHTGSPISDRLGCGGVGCGGGVGLTIDPQGEQAWLDVPTNRLDA
jgi:hypothetical protein